MKKLPPQTKKVMKIREEWAFNGVCWCCWNEYDWYHVLTQEIEIAG